MESKIEKIHFGIADFIEEEKWLEEQHKNGWCLIQTNKYKYQFEKCDADEFIYQLDFKENGVAEAEYIKMFMDCGWEHVLKYDKWCYFRKKKEDSVDLSIFSDKFSNIDMYTRILKSRHLRVTVALFVISCVIGYFTIFTNVFEGSENNSLIDFWKAALPWIGISFFVATSFSVDQYIKLRKMVEELKSPNE